jgi:hypothetical protein
MKKKSYVWILIAFALLVMGAIALRGHGDGMFGDLFRSLHGH